jgi:hypothetical protein
MSVRQVRDTPATEREPGCLAPGPQLIRPEARRTEPAVNREKISLGVVMAWTI